MMATITDYGIIKHLVDNDGIYPGDPQVRAVYEYKNNGDIVWSVILVPEDEVALFSSPYVKQPELLWSRVNGKIRDPTRGS